MRTPGAVMAPGVLCVEKRTQGKGGLQAGWETCAGEGL